MSEELSKLYADLRSKHSRFKVPFKSLFLCGGEISADAAVSAKNLRDYIYRVRGIRVGARIVRAETATQLYRDTSYSDLISFEEDIARIVSIVLVIAESPGSLAELGAFAVSPTIRKSLRIIAQTKYEQAESFIRYGPIENIIKLEPDYVAFYPWKLSERGRFMVGSASSHFREIKKFIIGSIDDIPSSFLFDQAYEVKKFYVTYWVLYLCYAVSITILLSMVKVIYPDMTLPEIRNILYCMKIVGWVDREKYSNKEYYFSVGADDPVEYKLASGANRDLVTRRADILKGVSARESLPAHIRKLVADRRALSR